jgi:hypothetical protein
MKKLFVLFILSLSVSSFGQDKILLNSETALVNSTGAILVRTAHTPQKVTLYFNVPMTRLVCTRYVRVHTGRRSSSRCVAHAKVTSNEADKVKISFKKLPTLGGSEEDSFRISTRQKSLNSENVVYEITVIQTVAPYLVISKGILGYDSYSIEMK